VSARAELLQRLHQHPNDFEATKELHELDAHPLDSGPRDDSASEHLVRAGVSRTSRVHTWWSARADRKKSRSH